MPQGRENCTFSLMGLRNGILFVEVPRLLWHKRAGCPWERVCGNEVERKPPKTSFCFMTSASTLDLSGMFCANNGNPTQTGLTGNSECWFMGLETMPGVL